MSSSPRAPPDRGHRRRREEVRSHVRALRPARRLSYDTVRRSRSDIRRRMPRRDARRPLQPRASLRSNSMRRTNGGRHPVRHDDRAGAVLGRAGQGGEEASSTAKIDAPSFLRLPRTASRRHPRSAAEQGRSRRRSTGSVPRLAGRAQRPAWPQARLPRVTAQARARARPADSPDRRAHSHRRYGRGDRGGLSHRIRHGFGQRARVEQGVGLPAGCRRDDLGADDLSDSNDAVHAERIARRYRRSHPRVYRA
jgi:hypothetical protein